MDYGFYDDDSVCNIPLQGIGLFLRVGEGSELIQSLLHCRLADMLDYVGNAVAVITFKPFQAQSMLKQ